ncbi:hypothetical protein NPS46_20400 [Pseudomonas putida]|uniref:hypothetical protein n=1 Tax=Pseudomonas putida TaxID=303 RepID=UPI002363F5C6|nr:hypothetical protein [Pseudomonas putida]MDD2054912.1 hypothetical protein [Pseudomonas putida]
MSLKLNERYPGRFNNPSAEYPLGSFKNRTAPDAKDGSYLEKDWANDKEAFFQSVLSSAGITPNGSVDKVGSSQFFDAMLCLSQNQTGVAFPAAGTATAVTLAPSPPIAGYLENQRFRVKFGIASGANPTINVSAKGAKNLKQYDSSGAKVAAVFASGQISDIDYDGTDFILLDTLPTAASNLVSIQGAFKKLAGSTTGLSATVTYSADEIIVENSANQYQTLRAVNITPSIALSGANGLDTGASAASTWYSVWVIWNGSTTAGLLSLSATSPTMPAGYTHKARIGWIRTDATANKYPLGMTQAGNIVRYKISSGTNVTATPVMAAGTAGSVSGGTYVAVSTSTFVPPTAQIISITMVSGGGSAAAAQSLGFGPTTTSVNPPPINSSSSGNNASMGSLLLESSNIYWVADTSGGRLLCTGWEDNL